MMTSTLCSSILPLTPHPTRISILGGDCHTPSHQPLEFQKLSYLVETPLEGEYGYFLKLHNEILYFLLSILLSIDLKCEWVHFTPSFLNNENEGNNQQTQKRLLLTGK